MKRVITFVMLTMFLSSFTSSTAFGALGALWVPTIHSARTTVGSSQSYSDVLEAIDKFEGTVQAYSVSGSKYFEEQVLLASEDISTSLEALNSELTEIYPNLEDEEQLAIIDDYLSLSSYLVDLADEANQIFQGDQESTVYFMVTDENPEVFLQEWNPQK